MSDSIRQTIRIDADPGVVFEALTTPDLLTRWLCHAAEVEPRVGGRYHLDWRATDGATAVHHRGHGEIAALAAAEHLEIRLDSDDVPGTAGTLRFALAADDGATSLELVQTDLDGDDAATFERSWQMSLQVLRSLLEDDPDSRLGRASMMRRVNPPGHDPAGLDCHDRDLWLSDSGTGRIYRLDAATGAVRQEIEFDGEPAGLAHDGEALWQVEREQRVLVKLDPTTGDILRRMKIDHVDGELTGLAWDGSHLWLGDAGDNAGKLLQIHPRSGVVYGRVDAPPHVSGLTWDGTHLWVAEFDEGLLLQIDPEAGKVERRVAVPGHPTGLSYDGERFWYADADSAQACRILDDLSA